MKTLTWERIRILAASGVMALLLAGCGGGSPTAQAPAPTPTSVTVRVNPSSTTVGQGVTQQFTATITGSTNTVVTWSVQEPGGGSITTGGLYTSPNTAGTFHVVATSEADPSKSAASAVIVQSVSISIAPSLIGMFPNQQRQFSASVSGTVNSSVQWSVDEAGGGSIDNQGLYTSPGVLGTFHITATSSADSAQSARATVLVVDRGFLPTGSMQDERMGHTATLLADGRVLITGGRGFIEGIDDVFPQSTAELYDPGAGTFTRTAPMSKARHQHRATLLPNGEVLITGGLSPGQPSDRIGQPTRTAEIFDPVSGTFRNIRDMQSARAGHTATALMDGRVLIAGGADTSGSVSTAEIFDPLSGSFNITGGMIDRRWGHAAELLQDGRVLVSGGFLFCSDHASTEVFDPTTLTFTVSASMPSPRDHHTATSLQSGRILIAGGEQWSLGSGLCDVSVMQADAATFDASSQIFSAPVHMTVGRVGHTATLLADGKVLLVGGTDVPSAELFDPATGIFNAIAGPYSLPGGFRGGLAATLLLDGRVLVTGGGTRSAELYYPN